MTVEPGYGIVVVRDVPAKVCTQCGADWIDDEVAGKIDETIGRRRSTVVKSEFTCPQPTVFISC